MQTLQIDQKKAKKLYPSASQEFKEMLIDTFGETFFSQKITDRVKTFEDACEVLGLQESDVLPAGVPDKDYSSIIAYCKLIIVARALNEGWVPDWDNGNQRKWIPYFKMGGFGFSHTYCVGWIAHTAVGSRLCFKSQELAQYAGTQFEDLYKQFLTIENSQNGKN